MTFVCLVCSDQHSMRTDTIGNLLHLLWDVLDLCEVDKLLSAHLHAQLLLGPVIDDDWAHTHGPEVSTSVIDNS